MINIATILRHNVIGKLLNHVVVFCINISIVKSLGATGSGTYFNELYLLNFIVFIFSAGLDYAAISLISYSPAALPAIHKILLSIVIFFASVLSVYAFFILPHFNAYFKQDALAIVLFSVGNIMLIFYQGILSARKKFNLQNFILASTNFCFLIYLWKFMVTINMQTISLSYAILFFIQGIFMFVFSLSKKTTNVIPVRWNKFIKSGMYIMFSSLIYFAFLRIDNFFVEKYADKISLGNYVQCGKIGQYFLYFSSIISSTLLPFISSETVGASFMEWRRIMRPYIFLLCMAGIFIAITGNTIFPVLFGKDFKEMQAFMLILLPGFICLGMLTLINAVYIGKGNIRKIFLGDLMGLILVTGFDTWLVPIYGAYAAAIISSVAYCLVFLYLLSGFKQQFTIVPKKPAK